MTWNGFSYNHTDINVVDRTINQYNVVDFIHVFILLCVVVLCLTYGLVWFIVFNATFNNISVISWWSALLVEETGVSGEKHRLAASH
jgi:hypothetical protein